MQMIVQYESLRTLRPVAAAPATLPTLKPPRDTTFLTLRVNPFKFLRRKSSVVVTDVSPNPIPASVSSSLLAPRNVPMSTQLMQMQMCMSSAGPPAAALSMPLPMPLPMPMPWNMAYHGAARLPPQLLPTPLHVQSAANRSQPSTSLLGNKSLLAGLRAFQKVVPSLQQQKLQQLQFDLCTQLREQLPDQSIDQDQYRQQQQRHIECQDTTRQYQDGASQQEFEYSTDERQEQLQALVDAAAGTNGSTGDVAQAVSDSRHLGDVGDDGVTDVTVFPDISLTKSEMRPDDDGVDDVEGRMSKML